MKIKYDLENCYGINKLEYEFDFNGKHIIIVHSPNGTMKTSLCKTTQDLIDNKNSQDLIDSSKITKRNILVNGNTASSNQLQVFNNYQEANLKDSIKKVMLTNALRTKYDTIISNEKTIVDSIIAKTASAIGMQKNGTEQIINNVFSESGLSLKLLSALKSIKSRRKLPTYTYKYKDIFGTQTKTFFDNPETKKEIETYTRQYNKLLKKSLLFTSGIFDLTNLNKISVSLRDNKFFEGKNKLLLNGYETPIDSFTQLENLISSELSKINKDPIIVEKFKRIIDKNVGANQQVSKVFDFLKSDFELARDLKNYSELEKSYLLAQLNKSIVDLENLQKEHKKNRRAISAILREAEKSRVVWDKIIPEFRKRFKAKFDIKITNKVNYILGFEEPIIDFYFNSIKSDESKLKSQVFSTGENRAYHMLQVLFEIELIRELGKDKIILFDDIADSYDYSNKLAILQYLEEIAHINNIFMLVLTHNFDFYRSVGLRIAFNNNSYFANKSNTEITIQKGKYLGNVFSEFKDFIGKSIITTISFVPFARNLIEYNTDKYDLDPNYILYTKLIHYRPFAASIRMSQLMKGLNKQFCVTFPNIAPNLTVYNYIETEALLIAGQTTIDQRLEDKMLLTIALRIKCEKFMYKQILKRDKTIKARISKLIMGKLLGEYKALYPNSKHLALISTVNLLVPPHIHVNNFMYEPMIDYSIEYFRNLYKEVDVSLV